jgi:two-component system KDP operon response regulator KdpE
MTKQAKILIVAHDDPTRTTLELAFSYNGYQVFTAPTGRSGLLQIDIVQPHLVILDTSLPDMDGWTVLQQIQSKSPVPVLTLTAVQSEGLAEADWSATALLPKPFCVRDLWKKVQGLLQDQGLSEQQADKEG